MNVKKILFFTLMLALLGLTIAFVLLWIYVGTPQLEPYQEFVNPTKAILCTAVMLAIGLGVFAVRSYRNRHQ